MLPVRLKPAAPRSQVKHPTTEPLRSLSEKLRLLKSSAANNCLTLLKNLSIEANRVDPDQTAPIGEV